MLGVDGRLAGEAELPGAPRLRSPTRLVGDVRIRRIQHVDAGRRPRLNQPAADEGQRLPVERTAELGRHVHGAEEQHPLRRHRPGDGGGIVHGHRRFDQRNDRQRRGAKDPSHARDVFHIVDLGHQHIGWLQRRRHQGGNVERPFRAADRVDTDREAGGPSGGAQRLDRHRPGLGLALGGHGILKIDADDIGPGGNGLGHAFRPQGGDEKQRAAGHFNNLGGPRHRVKPERRPLTTAKGMRCKP